ncbi:MAG: hypothetical protein ACTS2F_02765 [Thainema sp.]
MGDFASFGKFATLAASAIPGSLTVATITSPAAGVAGWVGLTTTTTIAVPLAAPVILGAGLCFGYHAWKNWENSDQQAE